ncbi:tol-pal system-associated acyl-CoA thioesterase [Nitrosomonas sp.]|uniref:tol-pal system-associated acyl-CoA thioesterase n=1 Tax=Nitrosomonas sp. TaxID=42353 RepID=UPI0025FA9F1A|nr:tol-pal system-associated acyl-CoA thioesterase [Nitrosomonas sp.]MCC6915957.1 tol-pal system-associated acyl-CoA thioesterase [Nitrosomonas sp.]
MEAVFVHPVRVYYQDTDTGGVVYHASYLNFMERARYEWLRELGFTVDTMIRSHKMIFLIRSLSIEYFRPAVLDDLLDITVKTVEIGRSRITLQQQIMREQGTLASATVHAVCVGADTLKPISIPAPLRQKIEKQPS